MKQPRSEVIDFNSWTIFLIIQVLCDVEKKRQYDLEHDRQNVQFPDIFGAMGNLFGAAYNTAFARNTGNTG